MPVDVASQEFQRPLPSPSEPSQCQPARGVYQATHPRVETGVSVRVVKSGSAR